jgi:zinc D-Ala-D-Ala carboxypeptidase
MNLSPHFTLQEMERSQTAIRNGIINKADTRQISALTTLCINILEPLRILVGKSINVQSGFRNPIVNSLVGGSPTSQHMKGEAADINVEGMTPSELFELIRNSTLPYDQLIDEFSSWVHVSYKANPRRQAMLARKDAQNKTVYRRV